MYPGEFFDMHDYYEWAYIELVLRRPDCIMHENNKVANQTARNSAFIFPLFKRITSELNSCKNINILANLF